MHLDFALHYLSLSEEKDKLRFNKNKVLKDVLYYGGAMIDLGLCVHFARVMSVGYFPFIGVCEYIRHCGGGLLVLFQSNHKDGNIRRADTEDSACPSDTGQNR